MNGATTVARYLTLHLSITIATVLLVAGVAAGAWAITYCMKMAFAGAQEALGDVVLGVGYSDGRIRFDDPLADDHIYCDGNELQLSGLRGSLCQECGDVE